MEAASLLVLEPVGPSGGSSDARGPLYKTGPECPGQPKDELRDPVEMFRNKRLLKQLGLVEAVQGRIEAYTATRGDLVLYGDPRGAGLVLVRVFKGTQLIGECSIAANSKHPQEALDGALARLKFKIS